MEELDYLETITPGQSLINVVTKMNYCGPILTDLARPAQPRPMPRRTHGRGPAPFVNDGFGDVFGIYYAVTAPGLSDTELHGLARFPCREVLAVSGVANAEVAGLPEEAIFVEPIPAAAFNAGVSPTPLLGAISASNTLADGGSVEDDRASTRILGLTGTDTVTDIANLSLSPAARWSTSSISAAVTRGRLDTPERIGPPQRDEAFTSAVADLDRTSSRSESGRREAALMQTPAGVQPHLIYQQHRIVDRASINFLVSLAMSVVIVLVLAATMAGAHAGALPRCCSPSSAPFLFMQLFAIDMSGSRWRADHRDGHAGRQTPSSSRRACRWRCTAACRPATLPRLPPARPRCRCSAPP
ncbi:MAG: hypothetical protein R3D59_12495 [Paracoccaceae bacterium]